MPPTSRWRHSRGARRSYTFATLHPQPPQRAIEVVGSTSQSTPSSVNDTATTRVDLKRSTWLSRVVARTGSWPPGGLFGNGLGTPDPVRVPPPPRARRRSRRYPAILRPPATPPLPPCTHSTWWRAEVFRGEL